MKTFIKLISLALSMIMLVSVLGACNTGVSGDITTDEPAGTTDEPVNTTDEPVSTTDAPATNTYELKNYSLGDIADSIKITGRSKVTNGGIAVNWSASGIEFNADCRGDVILHISSTGAAKYSVFVDGAKQNDIYLKNGADNYTVATGLSEGVHSIRLVKLTDAESVNTFVRLSVNGLIDERPADKELYIEFIGDSITCGYGLGVASGSGAPSLQNYDNDATKGWAYLYAQKMNADYSLVSIGGIGAIASTDRHEGRVMNDLYPYNFYKDTAKEYTATRKADCVMVALNTNDNGRVDASMEEAYLGKVKALVETIKETHGDDVIIIWVHSLMFSTGQCDTWAQEYFASLGGPRAGYWNISASPNSSGINSHPTAEANASNVDSIIKRIETLKKLLDIK